MFVGGLLLCVINEEDIHENEGLVYSWRRGVTNR